MEYQALYGTQLQSDITIHCPPLGFGEGSPCSEPQKSRGWVLTAPALRCLLWNGVQPLRLSFRRRGLILNISSGVALRPWPLYSLYSASKVSDKLPKSLPSSSKQVVPVILLGTQGAVSKAGGSKHQDMKCFLSHCRLLCAHFPRL